MEFEKVDDNENHRENDQKNRNSVDLPQGYLSCLIDLQGQLNHMVDHPGVYYNQVQAWIKNQKYENFSVVKSNTVLFGDLKKKR